MNIIEAILSRNNKYILLISGYLWWKGMDEIVEALAENLGFEVLKINQLLPYNKLVTSADHINFTPINELMKEKLDYNRKKGLSKGYIIVSFTFPFERLDYYPDFHININVNPTLLTTITVDLMKTYKISRMEVDAHLSYLSKSWKTNKIQKFIIFPHNYQDKDVLNNLYAIMFDSIMDGIMKKLYGEKYEEYKNANLIGIKNKELINVSDNDKLSVKDIQNINQGVKTAELIDELDDIVIKSDDSDSDSDSDSDINIKLNTEINLNANKIINIDTESESASNSEFNLKTNSKTDSESNSVSKSDTKSNLDTELDETETQTDTNKKGGSKNNIKYIGKRKIKSIINI
jgi:hypothetical protein